MRTKATITAIQVSIPKTTPTTNPGLFESVFSDMLKVVFSDMLKAESSGKGEKQSEKYFYCSVPEYCFITIGNLLNFVIYLLVNKLL